MKRQRKKYKTPTKPWDKQRIEKEAILLKNYGLKKKRELWRAETLLRKYRRMARNLAAVKDKEKEKVLIKKLAELGLLNETATLDDVLGLTLENILDRRIQTVLFKKGLSNTIKEARQLIVHGNVMIGGRKMIYPSYVTSKEDENNIQMLIPPKIVKREVKEEMKEM
jgi:small subunit ribosomal protein S4